MVEGALVSRSDSFRYVQLPPVHARTAFSLVQSSPFRANVDPEIQRFGLMWKLYTRARKARQLPLALATSREEGSKEAHLNSDLNHISILEGG